MSDREEKIVGLLVLALILMFVLSGCTVVSTSDPEWTWPNGMGGSILQPKEEGDE